MEQFHGTNSNSVLPNVILNEEINLLDLAVTGQYIIPLSYVIQLFKYAFHYQVYEIFEPLMEPISDLVEKAGSRDMPMIALLQILYEIDQCEKERKATQLAKAQAMAADKKKQRTKSPYKGKDTASRKKSPENIKGKMKKSKAVQELLNAAKSTRPIKIEQPAEETIEEQQSLEELLEDLCFLLLNNVQDRLEPDILIDISLFLWNKCRPILRRFYHEPNENQRWLTRLDHDHVKVSSLSSSIRSILS